MKKKKIALKGLKLDKSHILSLNAENQVQGGGNSILDPGNKTILPPTTTFTDPTRATFCYFCPPAQSQDRFCITNDIGVLN